MNLNFLHTFLVVVAEGNFSRAASRLHISQPAVSMQMQALASELGVELFRRKGQKLELTEGGTILYSQASQLLDLWQGTVHRLEGLGKQLRGRLYIGASTIPGDYLLPPLLVEFYRLHRDCQLQMAVASSREIIQALMGGRLDLAVVGYRPEESGLESQVLYRDELVAVISPEHELARQETLDLSAPLASPLLLRYRGSATRELFVEGLAAIGIDIKELPLAMELGSNGALLSAASLGSGVAIVSNLAAAEYIRRGLLVAKPVAGLDLRRRFWLVLTATPRSPLLKAFIEFLKRSDQNV